MIQMQASQWHATFLADQGVKVALVHFTHGGKTRASSAKNSKLTDLIQLDRREINL